MKMYKSDRPLKDNTGTAAPGNEISGHMSDPDVQRSVAFATDLFEKDVTIRTLLESLAEGVVVIDNTASIILVNKQAERLFGYSKDEIVGRPLNILLPGRFQADHPRHVADFFDKPKIRPMGLEQELAARHKSGREFPVEISLSHLETTSGRLAMAFIIDISLRKEAMKNLESRNAELDAFAHTVAHDLRGSLSALIGYSELLSDPEVNLNETQIRDSLDMIGRISRKMSDVVNELLLLSSVRKEDVNVAPFDSDSIIREALFRLRHKIEEQGAEISLEKGFPQAIGYAPWLEEVWYNYISNALKYGGTPPRITLGGELTGDGYVRFWVKDNGPGLSHSEQSQLFIPFSSRTNHSKGTGLGLSIVKSIVEKLDGYVGVESEMNKGSVFSFKLPAAQ
jgi:PAS domain S-box-containing protein